MSDPAALRPPSEFEYVRWHWLIPHNNYDTALSSDEPEVMIWCPFLNREFCNLDYWRTQRGTVTVEGAAYLGWRYHGPCLPNAIVPDAEDEAMVEVVARGLASNPAPGDYDEVPVDEVFRRPRYAHLKQMYERQARAVLAALRKGAGG